MAGTNNTKQAFWIAIGSLASFGFGIISSMILSRYFNKADYGTYKQVLYVYNTLLTVFTLGLPKAFSYFLPRVSVEQAKDLISKITNLFFLLGGIFSVLLFIFAGVVADFLKNPDLVVAIRIFAIVPFLMMPTMGLEGILATFKKTKFMTFYVVSTRIIMLCCVAIPVMIFQLSYREALIGFVIGSFLSFALALYLKYYPVRGAIKEKCRVSYREIFRFSLPLLYASLWGVLIRSTDQFFISRYYGNVCFAEFSNGNMDLPFVGMIVGACSAVLSPLFSRMNHQQVDPEKEMFPVWKSVFEKSAMLIYPLLLFCWFFADVVMTAMFGAQYTDSCIYFRIKLLTDFFGIIMFAPLLINTGRVKFYSNVHAGIAIAVIVLEYISVITVKSPYAVSVVSMTCQIAKVFILLWGVSKYFGMSITQLFPFKVLFKVLIPSVVLLFPLHYLLTTLCQWNEWIVLLVGFCIFAPLFCIGSKMLKINYIDIIKPLLKK